MLEIIEDLGGALFLAGPIAQIALFFVYSGWRPNFKRVKPPEHSLAVVIRNVGLSALAQGIGFTAAVLANSQPEDWISAIFTVGLCAIVWPILSTGYLIFLLRRDGYLRRPDEPDWWKEVQRAEGRNHDT